MNVRVDRKNILFVDWITPSQQIMNVMTGPVLTLLVLGPLSPGFCDLLPNNGSSD